MRVPTVHAGGEKFLAINESYHKISCHAGLPFCIDSGSRDCYAVPKMDQSPGI